MCMFYISTKQVRKLKHCAAFLPQPPALQFQMSVTGVDVVQVRTMKAFYRHTSRMTFASAQYLLQRPSIMSLI